MQAKRVLSLALSIFILSVSRPEMTRAQRPINLGHVEPVREIRLGRIDMEVESIGQLFSDLSLRYEIPIGLEIAANDNDTLIHHLNFKGGTVAELLTQFVAQHEEYTWEMNDGVVNVFPKDKYRDPILQELLGVKIRNFSIRENTTCQALERTLIETSEIRNLMSATGLIHAESNLTGFYIPQVGQHFRLQVSDTSVRSILNKVINESPVAKVWVAKLYASDRAFYVRINARREESEKNMPNQLKTKSLDN